MITGLPVEVKTKPVLDSEFTPALLWVRAYESMVAQAGGGTPIAIALQRPDGSCFVHRISVLPHEGNNVALNNKYVERFVKFLLWHQGGSRVVVGGCDELGAMLSDAYREGGKRAFDHDIVGRRMFLEPISVRTCPLAEMPEPHDATMSLGRHLDGCRIGFDLGGSDRKCAAVVDGQVVHSEEVEWNPYFEHDPQYHIAGIADSLKRAAAHLPRVDAIGGSAAGVYVDNEPRVASLFRGISDADFDTHIRPLFKNLRAQWNGVPLDVANDGEVTALAASMSLDDNAVLGISMGTSQAAGYCDRDGHITCWLNELAFVPVDFRDGAPADEWSGDIGCGVQYFSQQAVARLAPKAGIDLPDEMPLAERLKEVQSLMKGGDDRARRIYETIGVYFGYSIPWYARFYEIRNLLILGRVTSGEGGQVIIDTAGRILADEFPELSDAIRMTTPDEQFKRHGQAIAAASLPAI